MQQNYSWTKSIKNKNKLCRFHYLAKKSYLIVQSKKFDELCYFTVLHKYLVNFIKKLLIYNCIEENAKKILIEVVSSRIKFIALQLIIAQQKYLMLRTAYRQ